jgi:hypothetical protein
MGMFNAAKRHFGETLAKLRHSVEFVKSATSTRTITP